MVHLHSRDQVVFEEGRWQHWRYAILAHHPSDPPSRVAIVSSPEDGWVELRFDPNGNPDFWPDLLNFIVDFFENTLHLPRLRVRPVVPITNSGTDGTPDLVNELEKQDSLRFSRLCNLLRGSGVDPTNKDLLHVKQLLLISLQLTPVERICFRASYFYANILDPLVGKESTQRKFLNCSTRTLRAERFTGTTLAMMAPGRRRSTVSRKHTAVETRRLDHNCCDGWRNINGHVRMSEGHRRIFSILKH